MNLSVKSRILLLGMIPLVIALWFMGMVIVDDFQLMNNLKKIAPTTKLDIYIDEYVHEVQKERGMSSVFLGSQGKKFRDKLIQQRSLTEKQWHKLKNYINIYEQTPLPDNFNQELKQAVKLAGSLPLLRNKVDAMSISVSEALKEYTQHNSHWLDLIQESADLTDNVEISNMRLTYTSFSKGKEAAGIERAVLSNIFTNDELSSEALKKSAYLFAEQHTYFSYFKALALPEQVKFYNQKMSDPVVAKVQSMRNKLIAKINNLEKYSLIFKLYEAIGYGGAIHQFKNYVLRGKDKYYNGFINRYATILLDINKLKKIKKMSAADMNALHIIKQVFAQYRKALDTVKTLYAQGENALTIDSTVKISDKPAIDALHELAKTSSLGNFNVDPEEWFNAISRKINLLKEVDDFISLDMQEKGEQLAADVQSHFYMLVTIAILVVSLVLFAIFYVVRGITGPLGKSIAFAQMIAQNNLTQKLDIKQNDEVGVLVKALNNMSDNLVQMVSRLAENSTTLNTYSQQMKQSSDEVSESMEQQSQKTNEALSVAQILVSDAEAVADMSMEAAQSAAKAGDTASEGGEVVNKAITSIQEIADIVNQSAISVEELNKLGENISSIISVIESIAEQTNLLALNAAIEAARAGEQGRGFAVVADEVRQLAQRTAEATQEVSESIKSIQDNTHRVSQQMQTGTERAAYSVELAGQASEALDEIVNQSKNVAGRIDSIAQASTRQAGEIGQISQNIQSIDELATHSKTAIEQAASVAVDLEGSAKALDEQISLFKLT